MTSPRDDIKEYNELYHSFTEAYINVHSITRDFYPQAKRFVEGVDPELAVFAEKLSPNASTEAGPVAYQRLVKYMNHFDDFTLAANKLFADLKKVLHNSDDFMTRLLDLKMNSAKAEKDPLPELYAGLIPELKELITALQLIPDRAAKLEATMKHLENDWQKTKEIIR
jgi:hypothetical protein